MSNLTKSRLASALERVVAIACAGLLLAAPMARAVDDEMPDGDVDLVEKPKPKKERKRKEPRKEERKPEEKKDLPKKEEPPPRAPSEDDDILTGGTSGAKIPRGDAKAPEPKAAGGTEDKEAGKSRLLPAVDDDADDVLEDAPPARPTKPLTFDGEPSPAGDTGRDGEASEPEDAPAVIGSKAAKPRITRPASKAGAGLSEAEDENDNTLVIVGGVAGGLLLLAGAGVGGYFLVDALSPKTGSIVVTPR